MNSGPAFGTVRSMPWPGAAPESEHTLTRLHLADDVGRPDALAVGSKVGKRASVEDHTAIGVVKRIVRGSMGERARTVCTKRPRESGGSREYVLKTRQF